MPPSFSNLSSDLLKIFLACWFCLLLASIDGFLGNFLKSTLSLSRGIEDLDTGNLPPEKTCSTFGREKTKMIFMKEMFMLGGRTNTGLQGWDDVTSREPQLGRENIERN